VKNRVGIFVAGSLIFGFVTLAVACLIWPNLQTAILVCGAIALFLCVFPAVATLVWSSWGLTRTAEQQMTAILGGTGLRMFIVLGGGLALTLAHPFLKHNALVFWICVLLFYLITLALEMIVLLWGRNALDQTSDQTLPTSTSS